MRIRRGDPDADVVLNEARLLAERTQELQRIGPLASVYADAAWLIEDHQAIVKEIQPAYELTLKRCDPWMKGELALWLWRADGFGEHTTIPSDIALPFAFEVAGDWQRAADAWKALGCPYEHANALASSGFEQQQFEALAILEQLGATAAASALRKRMRAQGVREAQIPELLSEGLRNAAIAMRLFIATKTVDHHVSAILMKLGVSSRADAVAMARKKANDDS